jgi:phosphoribosylglycinamide formyltransferase-1
VNAPSDHHTPSPCSVVVLISGSGSNLQALIESASEGGYRIAAVVSNKADAFGLTRAKEAGIPTAVLSHLAYANREDFDSALTRIIDNFQPRLVVLAGFMRILSSAFVSHYAGRLINIHPSLLPDFPGINTHQRALDANVTRHGASVHFVTEELDGGPVIARHSIPVVPADTPESLAARVLEQEHRLYPKVVAWFAAGDLEMTERGARHASISLPHTHEIE